MLGPNRGMGPVWLQGPTRLKKCSERSTEVCDPAEVDQCCAVIPCKLCLEWSVYGEESQFGLAEFDENKWSGSIGDIIDFEAFWERSYETNQCEFVVQVNGYEAARLTCEDVQCRKPDFAIDLTIGEDSGTLSWSVREMHSLPYATTDSGCTDWFCGDCECTCKVLCVSIRAKISEEAETFFLLGQGELPLIDYATECEGPEWSATIAATLGALTEQVPVYVYLYRDPYTGDCWMSGDARGQELEPVRVLDCTALRHTWTLYDGSVVSVRCKDCSCESTEFCEFCCLPLDFTQPEYPAGVLRPIPFVLTGCGDEISGNFTTSPGNVPCTEETTYIGATWSTPPQPMFVNGPPDAQGNCPTTPCFNTFQLILECTSRFALEGDDAECDRLWLWIGSVNPLVGDDGTTPPQSGPGGSTSWIKVRAISCECDPVGGVSAVFAFEIDIDCSDNPDGVDACYGIKVDCCEYSCTGTLII